MNQKGFIQIPLLIAIIAGILVAGGVGYIGVRQYHSYRAQKIEKEIQQKALEQPQAEIEKLKKEGEITKITKEKQLPSKAIKPAAQSNRSPPASNAPDKDCAPQFTDTSPDNLKIFDAHAHMTPSYGSDLVISEMDKAGVNMVNLYPIAGSDDAASLNYIAQHPGRFTAFVAFPDNPQDSQWFKDGQPFIDHVKTQLSTGKFSGMGEINLRYYDGGSFTPPPTIYVPPDTPLMLQAVDLSATYHVPISFHFVPDDPTANAAMDRMLSYNKDAMFIWAHLEFDNMPLNVDRLNSDLLRYPNLYFDTAGIQNMMGDPGTLNSNWRERFINQKNGYLNDSWKQFFETWNSRILWASDAGGHNDKGRWLNYSSNTAHGTPPNATGRWRHALATLDSNAVHNIFSANARAVILKEARPAYDYSVVSNGQCFPISIRSHSSVSALGFDQTTSTITFKTADSSGTTGSAVVSIPVEILTGTFTAQVNGQNVKFEKTSDSAHTNITIKYDGGINTITITATPTTHATTTKPVFPPGLYYVVPWLNGPGGKIQILNGTMPREVDFRNGQEFDVSPNFIITTEYNPPRQASNLVLWNADGSIKRVPVSGLYGITRPSLSPDGKRVAVQATETAFSPPASTPVYFSIYIIDVATGQWTRIVPLSSNSKTGNELPEWFPGGDRVLYQGIEYLADGSRCDIIRVYDIASSAPILTLRRNGATGCYRPEHGILDGPRFETAVSADSSRILIVGQMQIYDARTGALLTDIHQQVMDALAAAGYQPDSRFQGQGGGGTFPLDGTFSPDGKSIVFDGAVQKSGAYGVLIMRIHTDGTGFTILLGPLQVNPLFSNNHNYSQVNPVWK